jgi:putative membrane protein insertion efficiency factor
MSIRDVQNSRAARLSIAQRALLSLLALYRAVLSPFVGGGCRFVPSCSEYAHDAVVEHGAARGGWLAARRLSRCHPLGSFGLDPVPPRSKYPN